LEYNNMDLDPFYVVLLKGGLSIFLQFAVVFMIYVACIGLFEFPLWTLLVPVGCGTLFLLIYLALAVWAYDKYISVKE
jgi:hypothetical protein